jgi:hypothetical protein
LRRNGFSRFEQLLHCQDLWICQGRQWF